MSQGNHNTSFYIETLLLILVFITVILLISQVFALGKNESGKAGMLTDAVTLAQNAAEAVSASSNVRELAELLDENGNVLRPGEEYREITEYAFDVK